MADEQETELRVGAAVVLGLIGLVGLLLSVDSLPLRAQTRVTVYLEHVGGLKPGAMVSVAGQSIGRVDGIRMLARGQIDTPVALGAGIALDLSIEQRRAFMAPKNGEWFIAARGVFGERYLAIGPPADNAAPNGGVVDGDEIRGIDPPQLDRFIATSLRNVTRVREAARELLPEWRQLVAAVEQTRSLANEFPDVASTDGGAFARRADLFAEGATLYAALQNTGTSREQIAALRKRAKLEFEVAQRRVASIRGGLDQLVAEFARLRDQLGDISVAELEGAIAETRDIATKLEQTLVVARGLLAFIDEGRGSIGGFYRDNELADFAKFTNRIIKQTPWEVLSTRRPD